MNGNYAEYCHVIFLPPPLSMRRKNDYSVNNKTKRKKENDKYTIQNYIKRKYEHSTCNIDIPNKKYILFLLCARVIPTLLSGTNICLRLLRRKKTMANPV